MQAWAWRLFGFTEAEIRRAEKKEKKMKRKSLPQSTFRNTPGPKIEGRDIPQGKKLSFIKHDQLKRGIL